MFRNKNMIFCDFGWFLKEEMYIKQFYFINLEKTECWLTPIAPPKAIQCHRAESDLEER